MDDGSKNPRSIKDLLQSSGKRLNKLAVEGANRAAVYERVCNALPADLAAAVVSAGVKDGRLTIGVDGGAWATRLRYAADALRAQLTSADAEISSVRVRVVPPRPGS